MIGDGFLLTNDIYLKTIAYGTISATTYPASGSYIDVSPYEKFGFMVYVATAAFNAGSGSQLLAQVKQADSVSGTLKVLTVSDSSGSILLDQNSKDHFIEVAAARLDLDDDYQYVALNFPYACTGHIMFWGIPRKQDTPVTQGLLGEVVTEIG